MLDLEVIPERALGGREWEFVLGMPLAQAVEILKKQCAVIKNVQLNYSEQFPLDVDVVIDLTEDGIRLLFDPKNHRLKMIEIYDVKRVRLKYCDSHFCSEDILPTVEQIHHSFGPTLPGQIDTKHQHYILLFRGILFAFPISNPTESTTLHELSDKLDLSELESHHSLVLSRVCLFDGNDPTEAKAPNMPLECFHGNCYSDQVDVLREGGVISGLKLRLSSDDRHHPKAGGSRKPRVFERTIKFGDSVQDVGYALGAPCKVFFKDEDKMRIHSPSPHKLPTARSSDYFYNYFTLGLDVLFDADSHTVKKFVIHNNLPGHYNFLIYYRCIFVINFPLDQSLTTENSKPAELCINPCTKWSEVGDYLTHPSDKPVVLNRSSSTNSINPFHSTYCYGYQNTIFEVMRNHHIASVTIYRQQQQLSSRHGHTS